MRLLADEKDGLTAPDPRSGAGSRTNAPTTRGQQRRRQRSVLQYIAILFAAAFVLLLYTFMMEQRQNELRQQEDQANIDSLQQQSVSAYQTLQGMIEENERLKEELSKSEIQSKDLADQLAAARKTQNETAAQIQSQEKTTQAMDWFWQINEAYVLKKYTLCRELIHNMEENQLVQYLPETSVTDNGRFSPADRYQEIYNKLL